MNAHVWVVQASCGDYYCEWDHLLGVYASEERAEVALLMAQAAEHVYGSHGEPRRRFPTWSEVRINMREIDLLPEVFRVR